MTNITQEQAQPAIDHMNDDHADANIVYVRAWGGMDNVAEAKLKQITNDFMTFDVLDTSGVNHSDVKVKFKKPLADIGEAHKTLVSMVKQGREKLATKEDQLKLVPTNVDDLLKKLKILHLSTVDKDAQPIIGYTQFVGNQNKVYVMMSEMTNHTQNILNGNPNCSVMFNESPENAKSLFALERLTAEAVAKEIPYEDALFKQTIDKLVARCGEMFSKLADMEDFHLFEITINDARYVKGFGLIFDRKDGVWGRAGGNGKGHRKRQK
ncbi:MAG: DUF2470 domain-containing protein [Alphaproteobacteria bacterium]